MTFLKQQRQKMVNEQIIARGVKDIKVLKAMRDVPREEFVGEKMRDLAYEDVPLPIEEGQTISQPYIVARMAELAKITPLDRVLEIGTGSGYSAAILSRIASHVYSIEWYPILATQAQQRLEHLGYKNITVLIGDGAKAGEPFAPFNAIVVTAGGSQIPPTLLKQLAIGGKLVIPIGPIGEVQQLTLITREDQEHYTYVNKGAVRFVPLLGG
jgi:protein-L-isoaspartate(D-aspartate) O-methyltransferase